MDTTQATGVLRVRLEALTTEALEESLILNRRIAFPPDCPAEFRRDYGLRHELTLEILNARRAAIPIKWPTCATAEDYVAGKRTIGQHVEVPQPDGSIARFHCRVAVNDCDAIDFTHRHSPGWMTRTWRKVFSDKRTEEEILLERIKWLRAPA